MVGGKRYTYKGRLWRHIYPGIHHPGVLGRHIYPGIHHPRVMGGQKRLKPLFLRVLGG